MSLNLVQKHENLGGRRAHGSLVGGCHFLLSVCRGRRQTERGTAHSSDGGWRASRGPTTARAPIRPRIPAVRCRIGRRARVDRTATGVASTSTSTTSSPHPARSGRGGNSETSFPLLRFPLLGLGLGCSVCAVGWTPPPPLAVARRCRAPRLPPPPPTSPYIYAPATTSCRTAYFPSRSARRPPRTCLLSWLVGFGRPGFRRRSARSCTASPAALSPLPGSAAAPEARGIGYLPSNPASSSASDSRLSFCSAYGAAQLHQHDLWTMSSSPRSQLSTPCGCVLVLDHGEIPSCQSQRV
ncbi:hypothetical protein VPH35_012413 [Triticum aestivum]